MAVKVKQRSQRRGRAVNHERSAGCQPLDDPAQLSAPAEIAVLVEIELRRRECDRVQTYANVLVERSVIEFLRRRSLNLDL